MTWHGHRRHRGPPPFVRRLGCAFGTLIVLSASAASMLVSMFFRGPRERTDIVVPAMALGVALIAAFAFTIRNMAAFFRRQDRLRRQLMADVAHELRTPLAVLQGRIEGIIDGVYPRDDERLQGLLDETRHLSRLVEDLRTIANAEAGALELRKERVDPAELIRDAAAAFAPVHVEVPDDLPPIEVDPVRIREVLFNLLANAKASGGDVAILGAIRGRRLVIEVRDRGRGIPPDELPRIFDRFRKGADSRGTGLGLAIARDLVHAHGGHIRAESVLGEGTTVTVSL
jgi:two-component system sensor histidine kinase BaeS